LPDHKERFSQWCYSGILCDRFLLAHAFLKDERVDTVEITKGGATLSSRAHVEWFRAVKSVLTEGKPLPRGDTSHDAHPDSLHSNSYFILSTFYQ
jgi:hypothetical protein